MSDALRNFMDSFNEAHIFAGPEASTSLHEFIGDYSKNVPNLNQEQDCLRAMLILGKTIKDLTEAGKKDLGVPGL